MAVAAVAAVALAGTGAAAQAGGAPPDSADDSVRSDTVPVVAHPAVVVRAMRTPMAADALPFAVSVRRPGDLLPTAGLSLAGALPAVPGLQVQSRYNDALGDRIVMRGFGARAQFGVRGVRVLVDGIPATMPDGQTTLNHLDLGLMERAEILRGPAAAAYGNAAGGVLLLGTRPPPPVPFRQEASGTAGGHGLVRLRGTGGGSAGSTGWVASISHESRSGFRPHAGTERWQGTGRFDAPLAGGFLSVVGHGVDYDADNPGSLTLEQFAADPYQAQAFNVTQRTGEEGRHGQIGATWERPLGRMLVESSLYGIARSLDNPIPPTIIALDRRAAGLRTLLRSRGESTGASWAVGVDAALQRDERQNHENVEGGRGALGLDQAERVSNVGLHAQTLLPVLPRLGLFVSGRYDRIRFAADDRFIEDGNPDDSGERVMDAFSPAAGVRVRISPAINLFANVSTAFQTPTTTELVNRPDGSGGFNEELEPQRTVSYEVGGRAAPWSGISIQATIYRATITDALVPFEVPSSPGRQYFRNAAGAVHQGAELAAEVAAGPADLLLSYSRTDARFTEYAVHGAVHDGNEVPGVRPWVVEALVSARLSPWISVELDYQGTGAMAVTDANDVTAPGYHLFGGRLGARRLAVAGLHAAPYLGVANILDEEHVASVVPNAFGQRFLEPGPGRTFYVGLSVDFSIDRR